MAGRSKPPRLSLSPKQPPTTRQIKQEDIYFGIRVSDPFRWLESISSTDVKKWLKLQNTYSSQFLNKIPGRSQLRQRVSHLYMEGDPYLPFRCGDYYFAHHIPADRRRLQLLRSTKLGQFPEVVLDANSLPENRDIVDIWLSGDGNYAAYAVSEGGSEWLTLSIKNLKTGQPCKERLKGLRYLRLAWKEDTSGFYYSAISKSDVAQKMRVCFHRLHTEQDRDPVVYETPDREILVTMHLLHADKHMLLNCYSSSNHHFILQIKSLENRKLSPWTLLEEQEHEFLYITNDRKYIYFVTTHGAPKGRLVALPITKPSGKAPQIKQLVSERASVLVSARIFRDYAVCQYASEKGPVLKRISFDGKLLGEARLPSFTQVTNATGDEYPREFLRVEGYVFPPAIYSYNPPEDKLSKLVAASPAPRSSEFITEKRHAYGKDGVRISVYLTYKRGLKRNGNNPVILTGYGGFGVSVRPNYDRYHIAWMELGGVFAEAAVRGGEDNGAAWRLAASRRRKQRTFDDFIAVAEHLIDSGYTRPSKLGITGASAGGLLMAVALTQRPGLFAAVVIQSAPLDMLRYHEFDLGHLYAQEYGTANDEQDFRALYKYSPLQKLKPGKYPAVLLIVGENDDRVTPAHSYKFAATLQMHQKARGPVLLKVEKDTGHAGHYSSDAGIDQLCFLAYHLGVLPQRLNANEVLRLWHAD
jgi:prolyl oligopeptidase